MTNPYFTSGTEIDSPKWWRRLCGVTPNLVLSGDLHQEYDRAIQQLEQWRAFGITHIIDCRGEWSDKELVAENAPEIVYHEHGTHDAGGDQEGNWYEDGWYMYTQALLDNPDAKVLVHCHMGVNRAPSLGLFLLFRMGYSPTRALEMIREARPIAACFYADSAWRTYATSVHMPPEFIQAGIHEIDTFFHEHEVNLHDVIHKIRLVEYA